MFQIVLTACLAFTSGQECASGKSKVTFETIELCSDSAIDTATKLLEEAGSRGIPASVVWSCEKLASA
jgi:hypothetical protein